MKAIRSPPVNGLPWGRLAALLGGAAAVVIGAARGLDPEVVLFRAVVSAVLLGVLAAAGRVVVNRFLCGK